MTWQKVFYRFVSLLTRIALLLTDVHVSGSENVPRVGPLIVISNHQSNADPPLVGTLVPRMVRFMAKEELFRLPIFGSFVRWYGAFRLRRGEADHQSLRQALAILKQGGAIGMFPEGHRSRDAKLRRAQPGVAMIAVRSNAPILPVAINGSHYAVRNLWRRPRLDVTIGTAFLLRPSQANPGREELARLADEMMLRVAALLPEENRGWYRDQLPTDTEVREVVSVNMGASGQEI